jgi:hypothetical protein
MMMEDGLGLPPSSIATAKMLEPCVGVGHVKADLGENTLPEELLPESGFC